MTVIGGHQRLKVLKELNFAMIPCIIVNLDKTKEKMCNIALNKIAGDWDRAKLKNLLEELDTGEWDLSLTGWGEQEIEDLMTEFHVEPEEDDFDVDKAIEEIKEPICKRGDIWQLGEHKLMCGDSTVKEDVEKLMDGKKADMVFTDPPYGMDLETDYSKSHKYGIKYNKVIGDNKYFDPTIILNMFDSCKEIFLWGGDYYCWDLPRNGSWFVWDKLSTKKYANESSDNSFAKKRIGNAFELCWSKQKHKRLIYYCFFTNTFSESLEDLYGNYNTVKRYCPTQKPVKLFREMIKDLSKDDWLIIDLFGGSGPTLIACEQLNRKCYMMEIDPKYCDVIVMRWEKLTNKKAVKINER